ncbi:MAG: DUF4442 domain-containing protein [Cyclobacteriaceae bacterium]|nr:DUF4442 domain-containing protein [Cyclobacteriaceae bacterium]
MTIVEEKAPVLSPAQQKFVKRITNPFLFNLFLLIKLPMGFLSGMKIKQADTQTCVTTVPYRWLNQNPFRSTYFAVLSMAAELSTGMAALLAVEGTSVAVIIVNMEAEFIKMAKNTTTFTCLECQKLFEAAAHARATGEAVTATVETTGVSQDGVTVAKFKFTWSFKARKK